jgi:hypothetical protein
MEKTKDDFLQEIYKGADEYIIKSVIIEINN